MYESIAKGVLSVGAAIIGGQAASKAMSTAKNYTLRQREKNEDWYSRRYNEDATQKADAQRILTLTSEAIKNRNQAAAGRSAVMGGNDASVLLEKEQNAKALADATGNIAAMGEARKEEIERTYQNRSDLYSQQLQQMDKEKAQAIAQVTSDFIKSMNN